MTSTDREFDQPKAKRRWFRFSRAKLFVLTLLLVVCAVWLAVWILRQPPGWTLDHDRKRYNQIQTAIDADPNHLLGSSLEQVTKELRLENVPWDDGVIIRSDLTTNQTNYTNHRRGTKPRIVVNCDEVV